MPEVAPGIRRIGMEIVNSYLVEDEGSVVIVDAGVPAYWDSLITELAAMGRTFDDVRAVLLTHAHADHIGFAERARRSGVRVRIHEEDAALARGEVSNQVKIAGPYRPGPILGFLAFALRRGYLRVPKIREVTTFDDGAVLDLPGSPRVIHAPGHTAGMSALHFPAHDALFVGDALNTYAVTSGRHGPQLSPFNADRDQAFDSLRRLEDIPASLVLPGHGAPWRDGIRSAVAAARTVSGPPGEADAAGTEH
jgi:glyoxylase-like metal-dependent hydrolase (beta-lactamase superfamily II)